MYNIPSLEVVIKISGTSILVGVNFSNSKRDVLAKSSKHGDNDDEIMEHVLEFLFGSCKNR